MLFTICGLIVIAYLPGAALFRAPVLDRDRRAALDAEERAFWAVLLSVAWSSIVVLALAVLGRYTFARLLAIDAVIAGSLVLALRHRLFYGPIARRPGWTAVLPLALIALGCWLFFPPFQHVMGGKDPGVYMSEGIQIARGGTLVIHDALVSSLPPQLRDLFFPFSHNNEYYSLRFLGFFVLDPVRGTVIGQFPHLYPVWIAVAYGLSGLPGALATTPVAAILGLLAVYFAGARLLGRWPALLGSGLLALNVATVWFAREPNSEVITQVLLFGALLAFGRAQVDGDRFFAPVSAVLLGVAFFVRIDAVLALAGFSVAVAYQLLERRRPPLLFLLPLAGLAALATAYYLSATMSPYSSRPIGYLAYLQPLPELLLAAVIAGFALIMLISRIEPLAAVLRRVLPAVQATVVLAAAGYAYFLRVPAGRLAVQDARSLEVFTWYFPPIALATALAGYALVTTRSLRRAPALLATLAVYAFFVFYKMQIVPEHFWAARRFIPVILPGACLMVAATVSIVLAYVRRRAPRLQWLAVPLAALLLVTIGLRLVAATRAPLNHVEYDGLVSRIDALAARFSPHDLIVVNPRDESDIHVLALPLSYIWDRPTLVLTSPKPDKALFARFLEWASSRYRNVYFIGGGGIDLVSRSIAAEAIFGDQIEVPEYESRRNAYPRAVNSKKFHFGVYKFIKPGAETTEFALDVGYLDDLNVYRFHAKEMTEGVPFRWSRDTSYVALPRIERARTLTLWLSDGGRPAKATPARVTVYMNDRSLGTVDVAQGFHPYTFQIAADVRPATAAPDDAATLKLVSTTWIPKQVLGGTDDRELGVMVQRVEVK